jgi:hypothetical protein
MSSVYLLAPSTASLNVIFSPLKPRFAI